NLCQFFGQLDQSIRQRIGQRAAVYLLMDEPARLSGINDRLDRKHGEQLRQGQGEPIGQRTVTREQIPERMGFIVRRFGWRYHDACSGMGRGGRAVTRTQLTRPVDGRVTGLARPASSEPIVSRVADDWSRKSSTWREEQIAPDRAERQ